MDYVRLYDRFIQSRRVREEHLDVADVHHIRPRCLGGCNNSDNLIRLSPGDHLFAHLLLARIYGSTLVTVFLRMSGMRKYNGGRTRRRYEFLQRSRREQLKKWWGDPINRKRHQEGLTHVWRDDSPLRSPEHTERRRQQMLGNTHGKNPTAETSVKLAAASDKRWAKPNAKQEQSECSSKMWSDRERREKHRARIAALWADPNSAYNQASYRKKIGQRGQK